MKTVEYEVKEQNGSKGYFGKVNLSVEKQTLNKDIEIILPNQKWESSVLFGIEYILERIPKYKEFPNGLKIYINSITGHEVDTTCSLMAFIGANAFMKTLSPELFEKLEPRITLNMEIGEIKLKK